MHVKETNFRRRNCFYLLLLSICFTLLVYCEAKNSPKDHVADVNNDAAHPEERNQNNNIKNDGTTSDGQHNRVKRQTEVNICEDEPFCPETNYRSIDGSCNNFNNPLWGRSFTIFTRWLSPMYDDGVNSPRRTGKDGRRLLSPRFISTTLMPDLNKPNNRLTQLGNMFGQFLAHEVTFPASSPSDSCCNGELVVNPSPQHPNCFSILIPQDDPFFSQFGKRCMSFIRSLSAASLGCRFRAREQVNTVTSYIDASNVYGSADNLADNLRLFEEGKLRGSPIGGPNVLPPNEQSRTNLKQDDPPKFLAGDARLNQNLLLSCYHLLWFREHNRIAGRLARMNRQWSDETIYQEARRIVIAEFQHIVYNEYLPIILGKKRMEEFELMPQIRGFSSSYDENENPSIMNSFSAAVFRFGHSLIQGVFNLARENRHPAGFIELANQYDRPIILYQEDSFGQLVRGAAGQAAQSYDTFFTTNLSNHLGQAGNLPFGLDLMSLNIQRGRDHGLPTYKQWRNFCNLQDFDNFDDLRAFMTSRSVNILQQLYSDSADIELYPAMLGEILQPGEIVGPTVQCLMGKQFRSLKIGDRFWYENGDMITSFTEDQLNEIKNVTIARLICDNTNIIQMQPKGFLLPNEKNQLQQCIGGFIPRMNLDLWSSRFGYSPI